MSSAIDRLIAEEQLPPEYRAVVDRAAAAIGVRPEDVLVVLSENDAIDWSFGGGVAQYALTD